MKRTLLLILGLVIMLTAVIAVAEDTTTTTTSTSTSTSLGAGTSTTLGSGTTTTTASTSTSLGAGTSTTTSLPLTISGSTAATALVTPEVKPASASNKNTLLDNINLILDTASNYKRDRFILSNNYSTYVKLIKDNKGKESTSTKSIWADISKMEKTTLPEYETQLDKLIKDLRNYVQDMN